MVAIARKYFVHSSPYLILFNVCLFLQKIFPYRNNCRSLALTIFLRFHSGRKSAPHSSNESKKKMTLLHISISFAKCEISLLQCLSAYLNSINLAEILAVEFVLRIFGENQLLWTVSRKPGWSGQKFSNLKFFAFGMEVPIKTLQGIWSEMGFAIGNTSVFG